MPLIFPIRLSDAHPNTKRGELLYRMEHHVSPDNKCPVLRLLLSRLPVVGEAKEVRKEPF